MSPSNSQGVIRCSQVRTASAPETSNISVCAASITSRLSQTSAAAPATSENSTMGSAVDAATIVTMLAEVAIDVISHDAPTPLDQRAEIGDEARDPDGEKDAVAKRCEHAGRRRRVRQGRRPGSGA